ncbi:hypothetical protein CHINAEXTREME_18165 [Halobiforma lacisalsi AJ5]|uniref:Uncharacterized protein n=1 Tax=Natronobacterium lacisalsi AJ5 TaxID=358396 RepID=M0LQ92_NATLA|nr:DUF5796 family protein [Halobiforma lacisalsi]APW99575.1 hypothetical protein CHINAEXTREME_18165 [Halobiforma lacisalsi AJ5]EMA35641.1 hypothetical protein C445_05403 [Halobiforma lacisalsi AJ5]
MTTRSNVAPSTIGVDLVDGGVVVQYLDGREVFYHGPPKPVEGSITTPPGKDVHVLVTDPDGVEGVMTYVNDRDTHDGILETTGVGRVMLESDDEEVLYPGVTVSTEGYSIRVEADVSAVDGRIFVFAEDELSEHAYELVAETDDGENEDGGEAAEPNDATEE